MSSQNLIKALKQHLQNVATWAGKRVYPVSGIQEYAFIALNKTPGIAIIYKGGPINPQKGTRSIDEINIDIWAIQTIWKAGQTVHNETTDPAKISLLAIENQLIEHLNHNKLETLYTGPGRITSATITSKLGTTELPAISEKFSGAIGISIKYKVNK